MARQLPSASDYQGILQNLHIALIPTNLKKFTFVPGRRGPIMYSGGFVITSPIHNPQAGIKLALRLFYKLPDDMARRYQAISAFVQQHKHTKIFADVDYIEQGIKVNGQIYPICTMEWLEGETLRSYVSKNIQNHQKIEALAPNFLSLVEKLQRTNGSHGDLSHENIMVVNDELRLVDYDGMYVPDLNGYPPVVAGQENFQHPQRMVTPGYFGIYQDNFSAIAIYISLLALAHNSDFYRRYENGGNSLLFKKDDFTTPQSSPFLKEIEQISPAFAQLAESFREVCRGDLMQIPSLKEFLAGKVSTTRQIINPAALVGNVPFSTTGNPIFDATTPNKDRLLGAQGHIALVGGRVFAVHQRTDQYVFEFRTGNIRTTFLVFIEGDAYEQIRQKGNIEEYNTKWVKITGLVELNEINNETIPAIVVDSIQDITLSNSEQILMMFRTGNEHSTSSAPKNPANNSWRLRSQTKNPPPATPNSNTGTADGALSSLKSKKPFSGFDDIN